MILCRTHQVINENEDEKNLLSLPLTNDKLSQLQAQDTLCSHIITQLKKGNITDGQTYKLHINVLKRNVTDKDKTYKTIVLPRALTAQILKMAHDDLGHNGKH